VPVGFGKDFERKFGGAVKAETGNPYAASPAANMDHEAAAVAAHVRQYGPIHAHGAKEICVENALRLFERAGLSQAQEKITGVVHENVDAVSLCYDDVNSAFDGRIVGNVEFEDVQVKRFAFRQCAQLSCGLRIPVIDSAHRGKDMVFLACKRFGHKQT
jgi:hypothetical protein